MSDTRTELRPDRKTTIAAVAVPAAVPTPVDPSTTLRIMTDAGSPVSQVLRPNGVWVQIGDWCKLSKITGMEQLVVIPE